jgi:hypothetical protein
MEALSMMISIVVSGGLLSDFFLGTKNVGGIDISHFLFADDTLIFSGVGLDHLHLLWCLFLCFEAVSGMKVNLAKLELVLVGDVVDVDGLADIMGCEICHWNILLFHWGPPIWPNMFGTMLLKR